MKKTKIESFYKVKSFYIRTKGGLFVSLPEKFFSMSFPLSFMKSYYNASRFWSIALAERAIKKYKLKNVEIVEFEEN